MPRPRSSTEAALKHAAKEEKLRRLEEKMAKGWTPPPPKEKKINRAPDLLEEKTPIGIQLTIFHAIAMVDGVARAKELQQLDAGNAQKTGRRPKQPARPREAEAETEDEKANKAWLAAALG